MPPDLEPEFGHLPDAAGWALGALDHDDAQAFQEHLPGCAECQRGVTDFQYVARALRRPSPEIELPPDLEERTITRVLQAAAAAGQPPGKASQTRDQKAPGKIVRWPLGDWRARLLAAGAAVAAAAVIVAAVVVPLSRGGAGSSGPVAAEFSLRSVTGAVTAGGQATVYQEAAGFKIVLHLHGLPPTRPGQYYGCWYIGPQNRPGQLQLITGGSFTVGRTGTADPTMWSAANPAKLPTMEITIDTDTGPAPGKQVLVGRAVL
jgi:Anti-sigma-K factor rskA